jgi:threonyl-tRNA synthetase
MPKITLPDGAVKEFADPISVHELAKSISNSLAKVAVAANVDGDLKDTSFVLEQDCAVAIITAKDKAALEIVRHSCAHLLAHATQRLFPGTQVTIGPVVDDGFYYDFASEHRFTPDDLLKIEKEMHKIAAQNIKIERQVISRCDAIEKFTAMGEEYKVEIIKDIPDDQDLTLYKQDDFTDLCRGPHLPHTGILKAFKLTKIAGAYWRGDSNNPMLQRIYGTAWLTKEDLAAYVKRIEEAEQRDHRLLAKKMDLFHLQEEAPGSIFWHSEGWVLYQQLLQHVRGLQDDLGFKEVNTPVLVDYKLWEESGHAEKFSDDMFTLEAESRRYAIKPMNCPCHVQIFKQGLKSYRDLPIRYSEFGSCHRNEPSGTLHGLMRLRGFVQDDGHIFCTEAQIASEASKFIESMYGLYKDLGFEDVEVKLSTRPEKRVGSDEAWDHAESIMEQVLKNQGISYEISEGEGAFYGPKYEFSLRDCLGRVWQCGTFQLDFFLPKRLGATYVAEDSSKQHPVMLHRAALGSLERFIGILLEHYAGELPLWLAPTQVVVAPISSRHDDYATEIANKLKNIGFRAQIDLRNEKIGFKIRQHSIARVPYLVVVGDQELADGTITIRPRNDKQQTGLNLDDWIVKIKQVVDDKSFGK